MLFESNFNELKSGVNRLNELLVSGITDNFGEEMVGFEYLLSI